MDLVSLYFFLETKTRKRIRLCSMIVIVVSFAILGVSFVSQMLFALSRFTLSSYNAFGIAWIVLRLCSILFGFGLFVFLGSDSKVEINHLMQNKAMYVVVAVLVVF